MRPVNRRGAVGLAFAVTFAACRTNDPNDTAMLRDDLAQRTGVALPDDTNDVDAAVAALLQQPLTEAAAVRVMLLHNHRVRAMCERLAIARSDLVQAGLLRNPVFDGDARFLFDGGTEIELGLAQPFVDLFWRPLRERLAEHEFAAARVLVTDALVQLVFDVRRAFVDVRTTMAVTARRRDALETAEAAHQLAVELHAAGNLTDQALALERAGETRARLDLADAELAEFEAREALTTRLGAYGNETEWTLASADEAPLPPIDLDHVESRAIAASLDLAAARAGIDAAATAAGLESWRGYLPSASFGASAIREPDGDWGLGPRVNFEIPLFDTGATARTRADATLRSRLHDHTQLAVEIRSKARTLRERVARLTERDRFFRELHLPQRATVVRTTLQHYNAMQIGVHDVLRVRRQELVDQVEHAAVMHDLLHARFDLQQLLAGSMPTPSAATTGVRPASAVDEPERRH